MDDQGQHEVNKPTKTTQLTLAPFDSAHSILHALQTRDAASLQAVLTQIDKRASALNAKPAPRGAPDLLLDYLSQNPRCEGVFQAWDLANKTNNSPLSTAVLSCLTSLLRLLSTDPFTPSPEVIKTLLSATYTPYLERALNPGRNDVTTAALKLCNVLVGFAGGRFARRTFGAFGGWNPKITSRLFKTRLRTLNSSNALSKPDLRTLLVLLVMGFLSAGDVRLKAAVLETKGLLSGVYKGLNEDPEIVVNLVLETVGREVVIDRRVGLEPRRNAFDEATINELVKLYQYPISTPADEPLPPSHPSLSIHRFLRLISFWLADQIASSPIGRSSGPQKVLTNVLKSLKVTEEHDQRQLGLEILAAAPLLAGQFWSKFPSSLDPRLSSRWISAITFATQVVALPVPTTLSPTLVAGSAAAPVPPTLSSLLDLISPPPTASTLTRAWYTKSLSHDTPLVSFLSSLFLLAIMQKGAKVLEALAETSRRLEEGEGGRWAETARKVREEMKNRLPDPAVVIGLMSRTVAAASGGAATGGDGEKQKKGKKGGVVEKKETKEVASASTAAGASAGAEGALLRTNVALRLLFLYHRLCPSLIATLKFDFAKLPQTFASTSTPVPSSSASAASSPAGLEALSSAYALRLAAAHSASSGSATAAWSRPADHYKLVLSPLFELYRSNRAAVTKSNRTLLREILRRQLGSPVLFGGEEDEAGVWLRALGEGASGGGGGGGAGVRERETLEFFQEAVRKTLTTRSAAPTAPSTTDEVVFSPLLRTVLATLPSLSSPPPPTILAFLRALYLSFLSSSPSLALPRKLLTELKDALSLKGEEGRKVAKGLKECLAVVEGGKKEKVDAAEGLEEKVEELEREREEEDGEGEEGEGEVEKYLEALGPRSANVMKALEEEGKEEVLQRVLAALPLPLVLLHFRSTDFSSPTSSTLLLTLLTSSPSSFLPSLQLLLHRFVHSPSSALGSFLVRVYAACGDESVRGEIKARVAGGQGVRKVLEKEGETVELYQAATELLAALFDPTVAADAALVRPFCESILADLDASSAAASTATGAVLPPRVLAASPLLAFFDASSSLPLLNALLSSPTTTTTSPAASSTALLSAAFLRVLALPPSPALTLFWSTHFLLLSSLSTTGGIPAAGDLLVKGAEGLLPYKAVTAKSAKADRESGWWVYAGEWASALLASRSVGKGEGVPAPQAKTLAALVYRSKAARGRFVEYLKSAQTLLDVAEPLKALLEVAKATKTEEQEEVSAELAAKFVIELVSSPSPSAVSPDALSALRLLTLSSASLSSALRASLASHLSTLPRSGFTASLIRIVAAYSDAQREAGGKKKEVLEGYVNACLEGLVRRFAEDEEDEEGVRGLVEELYEVVEKNSGFALKGHLLSPLVTAVATRRLDQPYAVNLATALSKAHQFKDTEVTRHLNEIFASSAFISFSASALSPETRSTSTPALSLILALSASSPSAAANARAAERLIPFYRATLSPLDVALLNLFQRIELASGRSIAPVLKGWNPAAADATATLLDGSRVGALGASQRPYVRRSWARAFASVRTTYSETDDARTYDPNFLVAFVGALMAEDELKVAEWTTLLESGALGTVVAALASSEASLRLQARAALGGLLKKIRTTSFREKEELQLVLTQARLTVFSPAGEAIPSSIALFLAHCTSLIGQPDSPLYPAFQRFLLQRATVDLRDVPMFYIMLYSSNTDEFAAAPREERRWMVRFLTEGLVRSQDWKIYRRRQVFELLASLFQASRADPQVRKLILQFLVRATALPPAARELLSRNGLLGWLAAQQPLDIAERRLLVSIVANVVDVLSFDEGKLAGVADAIEALEAAIGNEVVSIDSSTLLDLIRLVVSNLPIISSLTPLILTRLSTLLARLSSSPSLSLTSAPSPTLQRFYLSTMALSFVRFEGGLKDGEKERKVWSAAVEAGMKAEMVELKEQVLRSVCE